MKNRANLTKSLHTVSAVTAVAALLYRNPQRTSLQEAIDGPTADTLTRRALEALGQPSDWPESDETFAACVAKVAKTLLVRA